MQVPVCVCVCVFVYLFGDEPAVHLVVVVSYLGYGSEGTHGRVDPKRDPLLRNQAAQHFPLAGATVWSTALHTHKNI